MTLTPPSMVLEYIEGGSLDELHRSAEDLPWSLRCQLALDIAKGLSYLQSQKQVHRDVKSLNILLDGHDRAKLADFGLTRMKLSTQSKGTVTKKSRDNQDFEVGTASWMAPELLDPKTARYTTKSDMYSYALVLWEMASRKYPYKQARGSFPLT